jgi:hypothetical protein
MRALSIRQPWAWLIVNGFKDVENRNWPSHFRGRMLIHAAKTLDRDAAEDLWAGIHPVIGGAWPLPVPRDFQLGGVVGEAEMVGCVSEHTSDWFTGPFGFLLRKARTLPFQPCRGQLGFFDLDLDAPHAAGPTSQGSLL